MMVAVQALLPFVAALAAATPDSGHAFAVAVAKAGPRPAGSAAERRVHDQVRARFRAAGLRAGHDAFAVSGHGRSRNVLGVVDTPRRCLVILMAHADSMPATPGAEDNASGVGVLVAAASRLRAAGPACDTWLVATGAEERLYTGRPDHLGASALLRRLRRMGRLADVRLALSLDEVGRGRTMWLRSRSGLPAPAVLRAARGTGLAVRWVPDTGSGNSDHRELQLVGLPAAKLGVPSNPCRHEPCDRAGRLDAATFAAVGHLVDRLVRRPR
jgi:Iap family predicted aminopeptidase